MAKTEPIIITSRTNPMIVSAAKLSDKKHRQKTGLFFFEGYKLFSEARMKGVSIQSVFVTERAYRTYAHLFEEPDFSVFLVSDAVYEKISAENAPQGIFCLAKHLDNLNFYNKIEKNDVAKFDKEKIMMLCSLRDPGNVGTIIRSAVAFGFDRVVMSGDSADPYNSRAMRAAMGAFFKIKIDFVYDFASAVKS